MFHFMRMYHGYSNDINNASDTSLSEIKYKMKRHFVIKKSNICKFG